MATIPITNGDNNTHLQTQSF